MTTISINSNFFEVAVVMSGFDTLILIQKLNYRKMGVFMAESKSPV